MVYDPSITGYKGLDRFVQLVEFLSMNFHHAAITIKLVEISCFFKLPCPLYIDYSLSTKSELVVAILDETDVVSLAMSGGDVDAMLDTYFQSWSQK